MSEYGELVKEWTDLVEGKHPLIEKRGDGEWLGLLRSALSEAARAIERLENEVQTYIRADHEGAASLAVDLAEAERQLADARALIVVLADPDDCSFDHHGYCQAHGWFETEPPCPHKRAKVLATPALGQKDSNNAE